MVVRFCDFVTSRQLSRSSMMERTRLPNARPRLNWNKMGTVLPPRIGFLWIETRPQIRIKSLPSGTLLQLSLIRKFDRIIFMILFEAAVTLLCRAGEGMGRSLWLRRQGHSIFLRLELNIQRAQIQQPYDNHETSVHPELHSSIRTALTLLHPNSTSYHPPLPIKHPNTKLEKCLHISPSILQHNSECWELAFANHAWEEAIAERKTSCANRWIIARDDGGLGRLWTEDVWSPSSC